MFRSGYILGAGPDLVWFIGLPLAAVAVALGCQAWLPFVALASINLWITIPHHFATWVRTYGSSEDRHRFSHRLVVGPVVILSLAALGTKFAPITLLLVVSLWDHQHSIMQQHGFGRIYDFKAGTGTAAMGRLDLALHWVLYGNMFLNAPLFSTLWLRSLYQLRLPVSAEAVERVQTASWAVMIAFLVFYVGYVLRSLARGHSLNPNKYLFILASYFLWYFAAWQTASVLIFGIAHRIMHGSQYIVIVYAYMRRKLQSMKTNPGFWYGLARPGHVLGFLVACVVYALVYQLLIGARLEDFGFGLVNFAPLYAAIPELGIPALSESSAFHLYAEIMALSLAMTHYYIDSFIWKVRETTVQSGL